ncbi:Sirohydrochlorin cobaltochelatase CbiX(small) [Cupriavidus necator H850]|uniref:sirohydrochlorin chelatase n=1 Tax=Cupriavidus necator TaxID=106590 RepID=UPI00129EBDEA|nr:CbiX/SirB N-terminal domain-containing protein [Cupriavidus necator]KAI3598708.1 Sirohydrochlorin cobaltochelatase CbiX(small) [Cupriavidus necator H850]
MTAPTRALVLFAHGARDARWREPFDRLQQKVAAALPGCEVRLAFLELMTPALPDALADLAARGVSDATVVPVFLGQGGHLRRDLPALLDQCRQTHPGLRIHCATAAGEADAVLEAMAAYCVASMPASGQP